jgi:IS5 family transposase
MSQLGHSRRSDRVPMTSGLPHKQTISGFRIFISGQKRGVTPRIKRQLRRRSAVEPVIGHLKAEHRMGRNYLWYRRGDAAANAVLAAAGYNFGRLIRWLSILWRLFLSTLLAAPQPASV